MNSEQPQDSLIIDSPGQLSLARYDPEDTGGMERDTALREFLSLQRRLGELQELLYGARQHSVLIVLQGMDTSGKDGTIKRVMAGLDSNGCQVWNFKVPTLEETAHDYLWRIHKKAPSRSMLAIFNRSHYEDVLVARVHDLVSREIWEERYDQINCFEHMLAQNNTIILKFFLHISKKEQERRLLAREQDSVKGWKLTVGDWEERQYWHAYQQAYEDALGRCATQWAPWYIIAANKKWYRNVAVAQAIVRRLEDYRETWSETLNKESEQAREALRAYRKGANGHDPAGDRKGSGS